MFKPKEHFKYTPLSGSCADLKEKDVGHLGSHHAEGEGGKAPGSLCAGPGRGIAHRVKKSRCVFLNTGSEEAHGGRTWREESRGAAHARSEQQRWVMPRRAPLEARA
eukprot:scaffold49098_cov23-Tisochrysis_lutea.AAC.1